MRPFFRTGCCMLTCHTRSKEVRTLEKQKGPGRCGRWVVSSGAPTCLGWSGRGHCLLRESLGREGHTCVRQPAVNGSRCSALFNVCSLILCPGIAWLLLPCSPVLAHLWPVVFASWYAWPSLLLAGHDVPVDRRLVLCEVGVGEAPWAVPGSWSLGACALGWNFRRPLGPQPIAGARAAAPAAVGSFPQLGH